MEQRPSCGRGVRSFALHPLPSPPPRAAQDGERELTGVGEPVRLWAVQQDKIG
jgi:hypothetical protein